jgi:hypothetical protein
VLGEKAQMRGAFACASGRILGALESLLPGVAQRDEFLTGGFSFDSWHFWRLEGMEAPNKAAKRKKERYTNAHIYVQTLRMHSTFVKTTVSGPKMRKS